MSRHAICVVTGTRAEYGLLRPVMERIRASERFTLQVVATGMHLSPEFGLTWRTIEADGFPIDDKVEMLLSSDTPVGIAKAMGLGTIAFADVFERLKPDLLMILGDRFELLAAAQAALVARLPIAHISGGDVTEGAMDEAIRHSLTKMSHLHFVTNAPAARRVRQLGESPERIHLVGNPALDHLIGLPRLDRAAVEEALGLRLRRRNLLITFHPVTLDEKPAAEPFAELLAALDRLEDVGLIFTMPNADTFGRVIITMINEFVAARPHAVARVSLGQTLYWSVLAQVDAMVGNSSSGLLEAPSMKTPTVNIGDRQKGRPCAASVINCPPEADAIVGAIHRAFTLDCSDVENPYGDGRSAGRILDVLERETNFAALVKKPFADLDIPDPPHGWRGPTA